MFMHDPVPNDSNELYILSHTSVTTTAEISFFYRYPQAKTLLQGVNYYAEKLLFSNDLPIGVTMNMITLTDNQMGTYCVYGVVKYRSNRTGNDNHLRALFDTQRQIRVHYLCHSVVWIKHMRYNI